MENTIKDYLEYWKLDSDSKICALQETVEDMLTRLEECKGTTDMVKSDGTETQSQMELIIKMKPSIAELVYRIDAMEMFISRVHQDMDVLETELIEAELDFPNKSENTIKNFFKPILSKISPELSSMDGTTSMASVSIGTASAYQKPKIFSTDKFFKNNDHNIH